MVKPPFRHPVEVMEALSKDIPATIEYESKTEMEEAFQNLTNHYQSELDKKGRAFFYYPMKGKKSARTKGLNITHYLIVVTQWEGLCRDGKGGSKSFYRLRLSIPSSYEERFDPEKFAHKYYL